MKFFSGPCDGTKITWDANLETDLVGYNVYRGLYYNGSGEPTYTKLNTSPISGSPYVDNNYESIGGLPQNTTLYHRYRITAVDNQGKESVKSEFADAYFTYIIVDPVLNNWNLTSIPNAVCNFLKTLVYPTATSQAFKYLNGYVPVDTLDTLRGYWIQFPSAQNITYSGRRIDSTAMPVSAGWNVIGSISTSLDTSAVTYSQAGMRNSNFFKYDAGYVTTATLEPGGGYWVKSSQAGYFILKATASLQRENEEPILLDRFTIADAGGRKQDMYIKNGTGDMELPPEPPKGAFNVRFQTGNYVQSIDPSQGLKSFPVMLRTLSYPVTVSWSIRSESEISYWIWQGRGNGRTRVAIEDSGSFTITEPINGIVELEAQANEVSNRGQTGVTSYGLESNSPNPFNPSTQMRFQLLEGSNVSLTVFDVLGREVASWLMVISNKAITLLHGMQRPLPAVCTLQDLW